jgi:hypothetical protein
MADKKISELDPFVPGSLQPTLDLLPIYDSSTASTKKVAVGDLISGLLSNYSIKQDGVLQVSTNVIDFRDNFSITDFGGEARIVITGKQDTLVSGTNIKTINGQSILGSGDIAVSVDRVPYTGATQSLDMGEYGVKAGFYQYDLTPTNTPGDQGTTYWDDAAETVALIMNGVTQKIGEDTFYHVKNQTGSDIPKGTAVMFAGTDGASGKLLIAPFLADGTYPSEYFMGITAEAIDNGQDGKVYEFGKMRGIDTDIYDDGDILYASTTSPGGFQTTKPLLPNNIISVAAVVRAANNGTLMIRPVIEGDTFSRLIYNGSNEAYSDRLKAGIGMSVDFLAPTPPSSPYAIPILNVDSSIVEFLSNKSTSVPTDAASNTKYPSVKAVYDWVISLGYITSAALTGYATEAWVTAQGYITNVITALGYTPEDVANKSTSTSLGTSDTLYPSQNAVKSYVDTGLATKQDTLVNQTNIKSINGTSLLGSGDLTVGGGGGALSVNTQTESYTLVLTDADKLVRMNVASANELTIPPNSSVAFDVGTVLYVEQMGAGTTSIVAGSGVTINTTAVKTPYQYGTLTLIQVSADVWNVLGGTV